MGAQYQGSCYGVSIEVHAPINNGRDTMDRTTSDFYSELCNSLVMSVCAIYAQSRVYLLLLPPPTSADVHGFLRSTKSEESLNAKLSQGSTPRTCHSIERLDPPRNATRERVSTTWRAYPALNVLGAHAGLPPINVLHICIRHRLKKGVLCGTLTLSTRKYVHQTIGAEKPPELLHAYPTSNFISFPSAILAQEGSIGAARTNIATPIGHRTAGDMRC
mmetsp:Transcript_16361/g.33309  ORF Transcript_16361/g.33309 Transcript_16361/m.33309 type:complete len:218 (+) Transcript_16361:3836-4489(+)